MENFEDRVRREAIKLASQNDYVSYPADAQNPDDRFIHEYPDGRRKLIRIDAATGKEHFLKNL
jgi:predicted secreted protein